MNNEQFSTVEHIIRSRRSVSWAKMNGKLVPDEAVKQLLHLAHWAPTHARTEPWHFFVYTGEALKNFGKAHADLYWNHTPEDKRQEATAEKLASNVNLASHVVVAVMKRGANDKIPLNEEISAAAAAIQNVLLGATAMGIASFWSTGGMTHKQPMKDMLKLGENDIVMGLLYLGYSDEPAKEGTRNTQPDEKIEWMK